MTRVSIVVPCYQEAAALADFAGVLKCLAGDEIVFVDDGSTDATPAAIEALAEADPRVRAVRHDRNRGVGAAMRTGFAAATGDVVVVYDADRSYPPEDVARLLAALETGADLATASPWAAGGSAPEVSALRRGLSRAAAAAYRCVLGTRGRHVATFTCAFRAYRRSALVRWRHRSDGFAAAAEILGLALLDGARLREVPSRLAPRREGESKLRVPRALGEHLRVLGRLWRRRTTSPRKR